MHAARRAVLRPQPPCCRPLPPPRLSFPLASAPKGVLAGSGRFLPAGRCRTGQGSTINRWAGRGRSKERAPGAMCLLGEDLPFLLPVPQRPVGLARHIGRSPRARRLLANRTAVATRAEVCPLSPSVGAAGSLAAWPFRSLPLVDLSRDPQAFAELVIHEMGNLAAAVAVETTLAVVTHGQQRVLGHR